MKRPFHHSDRLVRDKCGSLDRHESVEAIYRPLRDLCSSRTSMDPHRFRFSEILDSDIAVFTPEAGVSIPAPR